MKRYLTILSVTTLLLFVIAFVYKKNIAIISLEKASKRTFTTADSPNSTHNKVKKVPYDSGRLSAKSSDELEAINKENNAAQPNDEIANSRLQLMRKDVGIPLLLSALMSLSIKRDPLAREKALELLNSPDKKISSVSYRALGYFNDPFVNKILFDKLEDKDSEVRRAALTALAWAPIEDSPRKKLLLEYNEKLQGEITPSAQNEALLLLPALFKMSKDQNEKAEFLEQIQNIANNSTNEAQAKYAQNIYQLLSLQ